jgi:hypothetical protein
MTTTRRTSVQIGDQLDDFELEDETGTPRTLSTQPSCSAGLLICPTPE